MATPNRFKTVLVLVLSGLALAVGLVNLRDRSLWSSSADGIQWRSTPRGVEVESLEAAVSERHPNLRRGDLLLGVQNIPVGTLDDLIAIEEFLAERFVSGTTVDYLVQGPSGPPREFPIRLRIERASGSIDYLLALTACGFLAIGLLVFLRRRTARGAFHFFFLCLTAFIVLHFRHSGRADAFDIAVFCTDVVALILLPAIFLHFCLIFPRRQGFFERHRWLLAAVYTPATLLLLLFVPWFAGWLQPFGFPRSGDTEAVQQQVQLLHLIVFLAAGVGLLLRRSLVVGDPVERQQMKWITKAALVGVTPFLFLYAFPYFLGLEIRNWMEASVLSLVLIPLGFGYAITRYRLMDVDLIFQRSVAYLGASSALLGLYVAVVLGAGWLLQGMLQSSSFLFFGGGAVIVALLFAPVRNRIQEQIDRYFYKDRYDYRQSLRQFGASLNAEVELPQLARSIVERLHNTIDLVPVGLFLREDPAGDCYLLVDGEGVEAEDGFRVEASEGALSLLEEKSPSLLPSTLPGSPESLEAQLQGCGLAYLEPLRARDRLIGFLAVGRRAGQRVLNSDDLRLIQMLAEYAAIALDNALLYRSLESRASELRELKVYNENVIESITLGLAVISPEGNVTIWNSGMERLLGIPRQEAVGRTIEETLPRPVMETLRRHFVSSQWALPGIRRLRKTGLANQKGETRMADILLAPLHSADNVDAGVLLVIEDITEKSQLENQLLQAEKLSSIGLFAAGVAHEVNTPLAGISSYAQMLIKQMKSDDSRVDLLKRIEQQSFRASNIVNNLLNFARVNDSDLEQVNLNSLMTDTVSLLDHTLSKAKVEIDLDLDPKLPPTIGNGGKLQQVFMNLFLNAKDAMPEGGRIRVETAAKGSSLSIRIKDDGQGISEEHIQRIYDPFFTTKEVGKGTGLGLSVSYGIIQEHSGRINVETSPGQGTTFTVELPVRRVQ